MVHFRAIKNKKSAKNRTMNKSLDIQKLNGAVTWTHWAKAKAKEKARRPPTSARHATARDIIHIIVRHPKAVQTTSNAEVVAEKGTSSENAPLLIQNLKAEVKAIGRGARAKTRAKATGRAAREAGTRVKALEERAAHTH